MGEKSESKMIPSREDVQSAIDFVTSRGGEFVEFFFESNITHSILCEDSKVERVLSGRDAGFGLRVVSDDRTAYGYSNLIEKEELIRLGREVLSELDRGSGRAVVLGKVHKGDVSGVARPADEVSMDEKVALVLSSDSAARGAGEQISQVRVLYRDVLQTVWIFNNEGNAAEDRRRQVILTVRAIASNGSDLKTAYRSMGGRVGFEFLGSGNPERMAAEAGESSIKMLLAKSAPAGTMTVVLGSEAGGTMIHEAIGHGLEGDAVQKGLSIYSGKLNEMVASPLITVVDDPTLEGRRGSYVFDDEGVPSQRTVPVEGGVLKCYLLDRSTAKKMGLSSTGNGRRESYRYRPIVRMSNTMIASGEYDPEEIISSVDAGLFVAHMGGGQVDTSSGDFVFKVNEAYLIEKGRVTEPVRGATLIGNGPAVLKAIDMVGNDLGFDIGTCGKEGQQVPVADAQPTLRIPSITVGGEA